MAETPICPLLSIRNAEMNELCVEERCALYLTASKKCSLVYIGFKALTELQQMQKTQAKPSGG